MLKIWNTALFCGISPVSLFCPVCPKNRRGFFQLFCIVTPFEADIISLQIVIFVKYKTQKGSYDEHQAEKQSEKPMKELLQEQSEELKTYIDLKHKEMEELIAESEGRLCEQIREKSKR